MSNPTAQALIPVSFRAHSLTIIDQHGTPMVAMRPIVTGMGLRWEAQTVKLNTNKTRWGVSIIETPSPGGKQKSLCMPLRKLPGWLATIHPDKVRAELRETIIAYQNECDDVLWAHWERSRPALDKPEPAPAPLPALPPGMEARITKRAWELAGLHFEHCREEMMRMRHMPPVCFTPESWSPVPHLDEAVSDLDTVCHMLTVFGARLEHRRAALSKLQTTPAVKPLAQMVATAKAKRSKEIRDVR